MINPMFEGGGLIPRILHFLWYVVAGVAALLLILRTFGGRKGRG